MSFSIMQRLKAQREAAARKREKKKLEVKEKKSAEATTDGRKETKDVKVTSWKNVPVLFLYGTQTGNAKEISVLIANEAKAQGHANMRVLSMRDFLSSNTFEGLPKEPLIVSVVSTTGQGDPPNNAEDLWRLIRRKKEPKWLSKTSFTILALGDTNYADFCAMGKFFDSHFSRLGAKRFYPMGLADDATGIDEVVEPWREGLLPKFKAECERIIKQGVSCEVPGEKEMNGGNTSVKLPKNGQILILTGEEDGVASLEAEKIKFRIQAVRPDAKMNVESMKAFAKADKALTGLKTDLVILFVSTSGPGEVPTNAMKFHRCLKKLKVSPSWLNDTSIVTVGLGNSTYDNFCGAAKIFSGRLSSVGGKEHGLYLTCLDKADLEESSEKWRTKLLKAIALEEPKSEPNPKLESEPKSDPSSEPKIKLKKRRIPPLTTLGIELVTKKGYLSDKRYYEGLTARLQSHLVERVRRGLTPDAPFNATIKSARIMTSAHSKDRHVMHLELSLPLGGRKVGEAPAYQPGDSVGIHCPNSEADVLRLLKRLKVDPKTVITKISEKNAKTSKSHVLSHIFLPCTARDLFRYCLDITSPPKKSVIRMLGAYASDEKEKEHILSLCEISKEGKRLYAKEILNPMVPLIELLERFPSINAPLAHLIQLMPPLLPRYYSISSAPNTHPSEVHVAFSIVRYKVQTPCGEKKREGVCTNWLYQKCSSLNIVQNDYLSKQTQNPNKLPSPNTILPVFIRRGGEFRYPTDVSKPIIMVGPGTGVAPFRGFSLYRDFQRKALKANATGVGAWRGMDWQHVEDEDEDEDEDSRVYKHPNAPQYFNGVERGVSEHDEDIHKLDGVGPAYLFFGCQRKDIDYIYESDLKTFQSNGTLNALHVAFSRAEEKKVYVQHLMEREGKLISNLLCKQEGYFFVCGDGTRMARDVMESVERILSAHTEMDPSQAKAYIVQMLKEKRYVQDIWS